MNVSGPVLGGHSKARSRSPSPTPRPPNPPNATRIGSNNTPNFVAAPDSTDAAGKTSVTVSAVPAHATRLLALLPPSTPSSVVKYIEKHSNDPIVKWAGKHSGDLLGDGKKWVSTAQ